ncbi:hypothetical protein AN189_16935 [Loktanella sp. 3ANDIMAR09]|uniref:ABC transporter ATP-binding protein n=1 Tax=Loktanella sp. 3ANDIMAR09 TaxID=1225657 RepID=UPI0006F57B5F|nr:ABC transporter ATP-binding protein [Loktanella sp. 3ANDIMAR09]KQI67161.1 hypothetical protein AN189_16935 [Loktanella sp. 3ANDIMAR09]
MTDTMISVRGLGKRYLIGHDTQRATTLREGLAQTAATLKRNLGRTLRGEQLLAGDSVEEFWALRDLEFDVKRGDIVGVVGANGAGKSTLLKVLSRITEPTEGQARITGRMASLLEVGTGFHPELTGRENIFLNGAILGMSRAEIRAKLDEIVDFSGVEKFLDTPVKRYSSGMSVRLAFSVAAHLEPEILVVDEVLAVGDAAFQRKSLGKMEQVSQEGRTVLIVSHNQGSLRNLCKTGILLQKGRLTMTGTIDEVLTCYAGDHDSNSSAITDSGRDGAAFTSLRIESPANQLRGAVCGAPCDIVLGYRTDPERVKSLSFRIGVLDAYGNRLTQLASEDFGKTYASTPTGEVRIHLDRLPLAAGRYTLNLNMRLDGNRLHHLANAAALDVEQGDYLGTGTLSGNTQVGPVIIDHSWS